MNDTTQTLGMDFKNVIETSNNKIASIKNQRDQPVTTTARNLTYIGLGFMALMFFGMIGAQLITGVIALFVTAVFGTASWFILRHAKKLDPLISQKLKNYVLEQQMKEAQENNIVQLQNILLNRKNKLDEGIQARAEMGGYVNKLKAKLDRSDETDTYFKQKKDMYEKVVKAFENNGKVLKKVSETLKEFEKKVYHYKEMAEFSSIADKAMAALENDYLEEMLSLEAFNSIETDFCTAMAELDTSIEFSEV